MHGKVSATVLLKNFAEFRHFRGVILGAEDSAVAHSLEAALRAVARCKSSLLLRLLLSPWYLSLRMPQGGFQQAAGQQQAGSQQSGCSSQGTVRQQPGQQAAVPSGPSAPSGP